MNYVRAAVRRDRDRRTGVVRKPVSSAEPGAGRWAPIAWRPCCVCRGTSPSASSVAEHPHELLRPEREDALHVAHNQRAADPAQTRQELDPIDDSRPPHCTFEAVLVV